MNTYKFKNTDGTTIDTGILINQKTNKDIIDISNKRLLVTIIGTSLLANELHDEFIMRLKAQKEDSSSDNKDGQNICRSVKYLLETWMNEFNPVIKIGDLKSKINRKTTDDADVNVNILTNDFNNQDCSPKHNKNVGKIIDDVYSRQKIKRMETAVKKYARYIDGEIYTRGGDVTYAIRSAFYATLVSSVKNYFDDGRDFIINDTKLMNDDEKKSLREFLKARFGLLSKNCKKRDNDESKNSKINKEEAGNEKTKSISEGKKDNGKCFNSESATNSKIKCGMKWTYDNIVEYITGNPDIVCVHDNETAHLEDIVSENSIYETVVDHQCSDVFGIEGLKNIQLKFFYLSFLKANKKGMISFDVSKNTIPDLEKELELFKIKDKRIINVTNYQSEISDSDDKYARERQYKTLDNLRMICYDGISKLEYVDLYEEIDGNNILKHIKEKIGGGKILFLCADAGYGKTTTLIQLYKELYEQGDSTYFIDGKLFADCDNGDDIPLDGIGSVSAKESADCIFFIDSVEDFVRSDNIDRFIKKVNDLAMDSTVIVSGRTDIFRTICELTDNIIPIEIRLSESKIRERISFLGLEPEHFNLTDNTITPLVLALIKKYLATGKELKVDKNGKVMIWFLVESVIGGMIKSVPITPVTPEEKRMLGLNNVICIISEYSWIRYKKGDRQTYDEMVMGTVKEVEMPEHIVRAVLDTFTDANRNGIFLHKTIEDYFLALWMFNEVEEKKTIKNKYLYRLMNSNIQRLIGDKLATDDLFAEKIVEWYCHEIDEAQYNIKRNGNEDEIVKYHYETTLLVYQLGRSVVVLNDGETKKKAGRFIYGLYDTFSVTPWCPEIMTLTNILIQSRDMKVEEFTYNNLISDKEFARIIRACYLFYLGDVSIRENPGLNDVPHSDAKNMCRTILRDMMSDDIRHLCLTRTETVLLRQLLEQKYSISEETIRKIADIDVNAVVEHVMGNDAFRGILEKSGINREQYGGSLGREVERLRSAAKDFAKRS